MRRCKTAFMCCLVCAVGSTAAAAGTPTKRHRHKTHVHGTATLNIAVEEQTATVEVEAPAESVIGFEHRAKSAADQTKQATALDMLSSKIDSMVLFD